jgi:hypothetical protein
MSLISKAFAPDSIFGRHNLYLRLRDIGIRKHIINFLLVEVPADYLRNRSKNGWSAWPAYLMWALLVCGLSLFVIAAFRL